MLSPRLIVGCILGIGFKYLIAIPLGVRNGSCLLGPNGQTHRIVNRLEYSLNLGLTGITISGWPRNGGTGFHLQKCVDWL